MHHLTHSWTARDACQRIRKQAYEHLILRGRLFLRNGAIGPLELSNMSSLCRHSTPSGGSSGFGARQNRTLGARAGVAGANLLPQPRDEDDVRVEAQWQEHVCRSNLVSGVSARVEGRGADSLLGQGFWSCAWVLSCYVSTQTT